MAGDDNTKKSKPSSSKEVDKQKTASSKVAEKFKAPSFKKTAQQNTPSSKKDEEENTSSYKKSEKQKTSSSKKVENKKRSNSKKVEEEEQKTPRSKKVEKKRSNPKKVEEEEQKTPSSKGVEKHKRSSSKRVEEEEQKTADVEIGGSESSIDEELIFSDDDECEELPAALRLIRYLVMVSLAISWICYLIASLILTFAGVYTQPPLAPCRFFYAGCFVGTTACLVGLAGARDVHKHLVWECVTLLTLACLLTVLSVAVTGGVIIRIADDNDTQVWMEHRARSRAALSTDADAAESGPQGRSSGRRGADSAVLAAAQNSQRSSGVSSGRVKNTLSAILQSRSAAAIDYDYKWAQFKDRNVLRHMTITLVVFECFALVFCVPLLTYTGATWSKPWIVDNR